YFDAQQLADFIMNSQFPAFDDANPSAPTANDSAGNHGLHTIAAAFSGTPDDYEGFENARARKRRITVSDVRRTEDHPALHFPDAAGGASSSSGLFGMLDQQSCGYASSQTNHQDLGSLIPGPALSSLPIPPGSEDPSFSTSLSGSMTFNGVGFPQHSYIQYGSDNIGLAHPSQAQNHSLGSHAAGRAVGRKPQSLSIAVGRSTNANE
ncbi:hypothetical protein H4R20_003567, partial [Coemansia guatemalensis]